MHFIKKRLEILVCMYGKFYINRTVAHFCLCSLRSKSSDIRNSPEVLQCFTNIITTKQFIYFFMLIL